MHTFPQPRHTPVDHKAFCTFLKKQAVLDHVPNNIFGHRCASGYLANNDLLETPVGMDRPRLRKGVQLPETVFYTVRLHGKHGAHPGPHNIASLQDELAAIFKKEGFESMPIACGTEEIDEHGGFTFGLWKAGQWERNELARFDETVPNGHGQESRCREQKFDRTDGDVVLSYPFPACDIDKLCNAITAVEEHRQLHCKVR